MIRPSRITVKALFKQNWFQGLVVGAACAAVALVLWASSLLQGWEYITWNWRVQALSHPSASTPNIKVIFIDQASLDWGAEVNGLSWPWPREAYVPVLDFCRRAGVKVVAFDMLYSEPSAYMVSDDVVFGDAIAATSNFVAAFFMGRQAAQTETWPDAIPRPPLDVEGLDQWVADPARVSLVEPRATFPIPHVGMNAAMLAGVKEEPDADAVFRRVSPLRVFDGTPVPLLGFAAYLVGSGEPLHALRVEPDGLRFGNRVVPLDRSGRAILRFRGKTGTHESLSAAAVIQSELRILEGGTPVIDPADLKDAYVFFGVSAPALKDLKPTPVQGDYPGVELHATFLDNLLATDFLRDADKGLVVFATILLALGAGVLIVRSRNVKSSMGWAVLFFAVPLALGFGLYAGGWWWPIIVQEVAVLLAVVVGGVVNYATEGRQKRFIKNAFRQYLSGDVIEQILHDPAALKLGGEKRELSIFFSDLQGFSSISERLGPEDLTALLNDYLTDMSDIIMEEGGTVDKYEGDAIIAFWNAPLKQEDHAVRACRAALRCQRKLTERREEFQQRTGAELYMRIGIHTGEVVVGNMGSHNRFNYTVLGDAANLASRLEGANKPFGTYLMVSESTWGYAKAGFHAREIGSIMVVGRKTPVRVFDVLATAEEERPAWIEAWDGALIAGRAGRWAEALALLETCPADALTEKYRRQFIALKAGDIGSWDGIWKLTEK